MCKRSPFPRIHNVGPEQRCRNIGPNNSIAGELKQWRRHWTLAINALSGAGRGVGAVTFLASLPYVVVADGPRQTSELLVMKHCCNIGGGEAAAKEELRYQARCMTHHIHSPY